MHLFYDIYTTRTKAELTLVAADMLTMVAAVLYLAPAFLGDAHTLDKILLIVWAATPRALARIISGLEQPTGSVKVLAAATVSVVLVASLLGAGWDLIHSVSPAGYAPTPLGLGMLLCAWGAGFLVCQPGAYRLFDFFLGGAFLVGLKDGAPQPYIWIPVFLLAICLSGAIRHLLYDVFHDRRDPPINLQNARTVALLGAGVTTLAFLAICLALGGGRFPDPTPRFEDRDGRFSRARSPSGGRDFRDRFREGGAPWRGGAPTGDRAPAMGERSDGRNEANEQGRQIGFTQHVRLRDLTRPEFDSAVVLRIRARPDTPAGREWRPLESVLWKGITLATYDVASQGWKQPTMTEEAPWPTRLPREVPASLENRDAVTLVHVVVNPVFDNFITPYFTNEISTGDGRGNGNENGNGNDSFVTYVRSLPGDDIFPLPGIRPYSSYVTRTIAADPNRVPDGPFTRTGGEESIDPLYLEIPAAADLGVDIRAEARAIFDDGEASARSRLESLKRYFQANFKYSVEEDWKGGGVPLREFLVRRRRGDCTYFATATALLLRAADLPTRFVVGFSGGEWEPSTSEVVVRNGTAHGWVEVHVAGAGWFPVDATVWVSPLKTAVVAERTLPGEALDAEALESDRDPDDAPDDKDAPADSPSPLAEDDPTFPHDPAETDDARELASSRPLGEDDGLALPGVVKGLRSLVRTQRVGAARLEGEDADGATADREALEDRSLTDWLGESEARNPRRPFLSATVRIVIRAVFLTVSIIVAGMLVYVYVRPRRPKKDEDAEGWEEEEEMLHLPSEVTSERALVFDRTSPRGRVLAAYHQLQASLKATRNHRRPHQTPLEHASGLGEKPPETDESFRRVHRVLYHVLYGGREVSEEEVRSVERHCQRLRRALG